MTSERIFLDASTASKILSAVEEGLKSIVISLDLGISTTEVDLENRWDVEALKKISLQEDSVYFLENGIYYQAAVSENHYYRLFVTESGKAPALLIDGVLMHRVKGMDPMHDAHMKAALCVRANSNILEVCTGLGYSTIACLEKGAASVTTIEKDPNVLKIAQVNPWSRHLFSDERIEILEGDATLKIKEIDNNAFDGILHDPPRFSMGSELYTSEFYEDLFRVLKSKGVLYHYVGSPGRRYKKRDVQKGVISRLRKAGFRDVRRNAESLGVIALK